MTLNEYLKELQELQEKGYGKLELIYSVDDEGNSYQKVYNGPSEFIVEDITEYNLEAAFEYDDKDEILPFTPNCIIIN